MQLSLRNVNKIREGIINLDGLTVIAGVNDSGKSTVGKMLFSLVKAIYNAKHYNENRRTRDLYQQVSALYRMSNMAGLDFAAFSLPDQPRDFAQILSGFDDEALSIVEAVEKKLTNVEIVPRYRASVIRRIENIKDLMISGKNPETRFEKELITSLKAEFKADITSFGADVAEVSFIDNEMATPLHFAIKDNALLVATELKMWEINIEDATFVESPLYLQMIDTLAQARTFKDTNLTFRAAGLRTSYINYHAQDMAQKLDAYREIDMTDMFFRQEDVSEVTGGRFTYDNSKKSLFWVKDGKTYSPINVASGIKSFGVIQMLLESGAINENRLLIWDEPENHLHPEWQLLFARLLVQLAQRGIPVLLSSHSPYFIQAIRFYSHKTSLQDYVRFYMAEEQSDGLSVIEDVSNDLNRVFAKLAAPMNGIMNLPE